MVACTWGARYSLLCIQVQLQALERVVDVWLKALLCAAY